MPEPVDPSSPLQTRCCIVGGGPAGMMLGYLLGRAGVQTMVLEKHADFLRDFRGDTVHPSTMQIMHELGLLEEFLKRPHSRLDRIGGEFGREFLWLADFSRLRTSAPFIAMMPQWNFLDFLAEKAKAFPNLRILRERQVVDLIIETGQVTGVAVKTASGPLEIRADLVIGCDGRHSVVRERGGLRVEDIGAPIDVLWFRLAKSHETMRPAFLHAGRGGFLVTIDRGDYWQCAFVIAKGGIAAMKEAGLDAFRARIATIAPALRDHIAEVANWDDVKLLTVTIDRLTRWARPGLLCIGDAAHAMSPVGGVGINLAIQDAVATANALATTLLKGPVPMEALDRIQARREWPVKVVQAVQVLVQNRIIAPALGGKVTPPAIMRLFDAIPWLRQFPARLLGLGIRQEHVASPDA